MTHFTERIRVVKQLIDCTYWCFGTAC